ncbi:MAG: arpA protein [Gammaproteobacteria bacterium]|nr:MAG: arpA protein [Gammaproteobacteria bacterium]
MKDINQILNSQYPINDTDFVEKSKQRFDRDGILILPNFLTAEAVEKIKQEGRDKAHLAYYTKSSHNIYLCPNDPDYPDEHIRNRAVNSSKGCITDDHIAPDSALRTLYDDQGFRKFLAHVLGEKALYEFADPLSSINLHYASEGQELGWHYDNSSFAITLLIQKPEGGSAFEFVKDVRDADAGDMAFEESRRIVDGEVAPQSLTIEEGTLVLFRGRNAIHRVTPTEGDTTRMLVVLAYNSEPGIALSESARMTFYGRLE